MTKAAFQGSHGLRKKQHYYILAALFSQIVGAPFARYP